MGIYERECLRFDAEDTGKDKVMGEIEKGGGDRVLDWIWRLCNIAFKSCTRRLEVYSDCSTLQE